MVEQDQLEKCEGKNVREDGFKPILYIGMDVHKDTITMSAFAENSNELIFQQKIKNDPKKLRKIFKKLSKEYTLMICYEAGGCGFVLVRMITEWGYQCIVIAPSLVPKKPGDKVKTDRRDSLKLAHELKSGNLEEVEIPSEERESHRAVLRARYDIAKAIAKVKDMIIKFLLVRGYTFRDGSNFTQKYHKWLKGLELSTLDQYTLNTYLNRLIFLQAQQKELDEKIEELSKQEPYASLLPLQTMKGLALYSTMLLLTEIGDFVRFAKPTQLMKYVGLIPSENTSGPNRKQGPITKAGNTRCRKILIEVAWHYARGEHISKTMAEQLTRVPAEIAQIIIKANKRLSKKYRRLIKVRKSPQVAVVAVARELVGFIWAIVTQIQMNKALAM